MDNLSSERGPPPYFLPGDRISGIHIGIRIASAP